MLYLSAVISTRPNIVRMTSPDLRLPLPWALDMDQLYPSKGFLGLDLGFGVPGGPKLILGLLRPEKQAYAPEIMKCST